MVLNDATTTLERHILRRKMQAVGIDSVVRLDMTAFTLREAIEASLETRNQSSGN